MPWLALLLPFATGHVLSWVFRSANAVVGPLLKDEFALSSSGIGLLTSTYFFAFALAQIPLGLLLDRVGARRVQAALLFVAAVGAVVFAKGRSLAALAAGRALIGLGVSGCLMAALHAFTERFGTHRLASVTGWMMAAGGLGALASTAPLDAALHVTGWRGIFLFLAAATAATVVWIAVVVPDPVGVRDAEHLSDQLAGMVTVFRSAVFWRVAPLALTMTGGFLAVQGLWSASWLVEVNGLSRSAAADHLAGLSMAMLVTYLLIGFAGTRLAQLGIGPGHILAVGLGLGLVTMFVIVSTATVHTRLLWICYGAFSSVGPLVFAQAARGFAARLSGRANTTLNVLVTAGAFGVQWGMGAGIDALRGAGYPSARAHRWAFAALLAVQAAAYAWFLLGGRRRGFAVASPPGAATGSTR